MPAGRLVIRASDPSDQHREDQIRLLPDEEKTRLLVRLAAGEIRAFPWSRGGGADPESLRPVPSAIHAHFRTRRNDAFPQAIDMERNPRWSLIGAAPASGAPVRKQNETGHWARRVGPSTLTIRCRSGLSSASVLFVEGGSRPLAVQLEVKTDPVVPFPRSAACPVLSALTSTR